MNGTSETTFAPNATTTRAMIVTILYRPSSFTGEESSKWYTKAIVWAAEHEIAKGYDNGRFGPNDTITRDQMAAILYRYASYKGYDVSAQADLTS